tara:strand:+ start:293 stop:502 length:210 start_codon:yes stop_codon:yes gene_type:complete
MKLFYKIGLGLLVATNFFFIATLVFSMIRYDSRVEKNRKWLKETIIEEVYKQIKFVMPKESGGVYVPNK